MDRWGANGAASSGVAVAIPGRDGIDGRDGVNGRDGMDGKNGIDGKDGADGGSGVGFNLVAAEDLVAFAAVTITGRNANSSNLAHYAKIIGISMAAIASGFAGPVRDMGEITNPAWTWTAGDMIYLNGASLSKIPPTIGFSQRLGLAKGPTIIVVELGEPVLL
jgi:hypothetical protein